MRKASLSLVPARRFGWLPVLAVGFSFAAHAQSQPQAGSKDDPMAWLQRAAISAREASYSGTFVHTNGERTATFRITHTIQNGREHERVESLDGPPQEIVRRDDEMFCYFPDAKTVRLDRRISARFFPSLLRSPPEGLTQNYTVALGKVEQMLGYECQWIRLEPKDAMRFAQRLCAEVGSGLLIRAKTMNARRQVIEQYTFTELKLGPHVARSDAKPSIQARIKQWVTDARPLDEAKPVNTGWAINDPPAGFLPVLEMRRTMPGRTQPVSQIVLSDGLASMSIFVEPAGQAARSEGASEDGTTSFYVRPSGDHVITVLGEVPVAAARQAAHSVARRP